MRRELFSPALFSSRRFFKPPSRRGKTRLAPPDLSAVIVNNGSGGVDCSAQPLPGRPAALPSSSGPPASPRVSLLHSEATSDIPALTRRWEVPSCRVSCPLRARISSWLARARARRARSPKRPPVMKQERGLEGAARCYRQPRAGAVCVSLASSSTSRNWQRAAWQAAQGAARREGAQKGRVPKKRRAQMRRPCLAATAPCVLTRGRVPAKHWMGCDILDSLRGTLCQQAMHRTVDLLQPS